MQNSCYHEALTGKTNHCLCNQYQQTQQSQFYDGLLLKLILHLLSSMLTYRKLNDPQGYNHSLYVRLKLQQYHQTHVTNGNIL